MPTLGKEKNRDDLVVFLVEVEDESQVNNDLFVNLHTYMNQDTSKVVKLVPMVTGRKSMKCIYPALPNDEIVSLLERLSGNDNDFSREAKTILRTLKIMKIKD